MIEQKNKGGRPLGTVKLVHGKNFWVPHALVETVKLLIQANRQAVTTTGTPKRG